MVFATSQSSSYTFQPPPVPSPNMQTLLRYRDALNEWDYEKYMGVFDETLEHRILPKSLGRPVLTKKQYAVYFAGVMPLFKHFHLAFHEVIEAGDVITAHGFATGESASGAPYANEYMLIVHFVPPKQGGDGLPKMALVKEFTDSATAVKFFTQERAKAVNARPRT